MIISSRSFLMLHLRTNLAGTLIRENLLFLEKAKEILGSPIQLYTFVENVNARRFYERYGFKTIKFSDGSNNEEKCPDILYEWKEEDPSDKKTTKLTQNLAASLCEKKGNNLVTEELLLSIPFSQEYRPSIHWLDNENIVFGNTNTVEIIEISTRKKITLAEGIHPKPSPNSQWIAFIKEIENKKQLFVISLDGKKIRQLTKINKGLTGFFDYHFGFIWSPCSNYIVLHYQPYVADWENKQITENKTKSSSISLKKEKSKPPVSKIDLIEINTELSNTLVTINDSIRNLSWVSQNDLLIFMSDRFGQNYNQKNDQAWIYTFDVKNNELTTLLELDGLQQFLDPVSSHNGKFVAFAYDADNPLFNFMTSIGLVSTAEKNANLQNINRLTYEKKLYLPKWLKDDSKILALRDFGAYRQIYSIDVKNDSINCLTDDPLNIEDFSLSPDGSKLAWVGQDAHANIIIRVSSIDGKDKRDVATISAVSEDVALGEVREIEWSSTDYPEKMRGLLVLPINYDSNRQYPLIVDIHGGGPGAHIYLKGAILVSTPLEWQLWSAKEYIVFVPEFRSSASFGSLAITRDQFERHDLVNCDIQDILAGVTELISMRLVDKNRMAVLGHSAGARRANWLLVSTTLFKTIVSKEGWADEWFMAGTEERDLIYSVYGGHPALVPESYQKNSSLFHAKQARTPTLFLMGNPNLGGIDRYETTRWLYYALKALDIESEYIYYPDEGHNLERLDNQRDALQRVIKWIDHYLQGKDSKQ